MIRKYRFLLPLVFSLVIPFAVLAENAVPEKLFPPEAILVAAYRGDVEQVKAILADGPDIDVRDAFGATALHVAIYQQNPAIVKLLLDYGFDPNAVAARNGYTPLHNAVAVNNAEAARLLIRSGANKNIKNLDGQTPLEKARKEQKQALVLLLYK